MDVTGYNYLLPFLFLGACNGFLFAGILYLHKRGNRAANKILAVMVFVLSLSLAESVYVLSGLYRHYPHLISVTFPLTFLIGPLFYFYVKAKLKQVSGFRWIYLLHLIPFLIALADLFPFYIMSAGEKVAHLDTILARDHMEISMRVFVMMLFKIIQTASYIVLSWKAIHSFNREIKNYHSDEASLAVGWIRKISIWFTVYLGIHLLTFLLLALIDSYSVLIDSFIQLGNALFVLVLAFNAIREPEVYSGPILKSTMSEKYEKSSLSDEASGQWAERLLKLMEEERPFLKSDLRLPELAENLGISTNHLSQVINQELGTNFYDFVNEYRVDEARKKLVHPDFRHLSFLAIAYEVGFSSKASFNRVFKKHTGMTPTAYVSARTKKQA